MTDKRTSFDKRVRRRISAREQEFWVGSSPGLEAVLRAELVALGAQASPAQQGSGGVTVTGKLTDLYQIALWSRTANRILMRVETVKGRNPGELTAGFNKIDWPLYIKHPEHLSIHVSTKHCRLHHTGLIADCLKSAIVSQSDFMGDAPESPAGIWIRGEEDRFTVSIDASGERMHKRGDTDRQGGLASIRETLASAILLSAGYRADMALLDPMCGSGTFSVEAGMMATKQAPGVKRAFAFFDWPAFRQPQWDFIKKEAEGQAGSDVPTCIRTSDLSKAAVDTATRLVESAGLSDQITVTTADFFDSVPPAGILPGMIILNPPYGKRLNDPGSAAKNYQRIAEKLLADFTGWRYVVLVPQNMGKHWKLKGRSLTFRHGGLPMTCRIGTVREATQNIKKKG